MLFSVFMSVSWGNLVLYLMWNPHPFFFSLFSVTDSNFTKDAFFISATDEATNAVEEQEDVDECQLYLGQLCQHTCIKTWGSYRCGCQQGYILQQDGHSCTAGTLSHYRRLIQTWSTSHLVWVVYLRIWHKSAYDILYRHSEQIHYYHPEKVTIAF